MSTDMQSLIIVSKNPAKRSEYFKKFCTEHAISQFDQILIAEEGSIGIEIVRKLQQPLSLKPFKSSEKILVIENAQNLTIEAQNALLKILEEPPVHTYIMLSSDSSEGFLPTVISRCKIVVLDASKQEALTPEEVVRYTSILDNLHNGSIAEKMAFAEELAKDKTKAVEWLERVILMERDKMIRHSEQSEESHSKDLHSRQTLASLIKHFQTTYILLTTTNVNPRFALENLFLNIPNNQTIQQ